MGGGGSPAPASKAKNTEEQKKKNELFQESLQQRYHNMKLRSNKMYFPPQLLEKIRSHVASGSSRVSKPLSSLLLQPTSAPLTPAPNEHIKLLSAALNSANNKRPLNLHEVHVSDTPAHMAALLVNSEKVAKAKYDAAHNRLGALDVLLTQERERAAKERHRILGIDDLTTPLSDKHAHSAPTHTPAATQQHNNQQQQAPAEQSDTKETSNVPPITSSSSAPVPGIRSSPSPCSSPAVFVGPPLLALSMVEAQQSEARSWAQRQAAKYEEARRIVEEGIDAGSTSGAGTSPTSVPALFSSSLSSPAPPKLHSAEVTPLQPLPVAFQEQYYTFSDAMKLPLHARIIKMRGVKLNRKKHEKKLFVSSTPTPPPGPSPQELLAAQHAADAQRAQDESDVFARVAALMNIEHLIPPSNPSIEEEAPPVESGDEPDDSSEHTTQNSITSPRKPYHVADDFQSTTYRLSLKPRASTPHSLLLPVDSSPPHSPLSSPSSPNGSVLNMPISARIFAVTNKERYLTQLKESEMIQHQYAKRESEFAERAVTVMSQPLPIVNEEHSHSTHSLDAAPHQQNQTILSLESSKSSLSDRLAPLQSHDASTLYSPFRSELSCAPPISHVSGLAMTRGPRVGSPARRTARRTSRDDPSHQLTTITTAWHTERGALFQAVKHDTHQLQERQTMRDALKLKEDEIVPTELMLHTPAQLHTVSAPPLPKQHLHNHLHQLSSASLASMGSSNNTHVKHVEFSQPPNFIHTHASVHSTSSSSQQLDHLSSPSSAVPDAPIVSSAGPRHLSSMAAFVAPLAPLKSSGLHDLTLGLTAVQQALPANSQARKITRLYGFYQRHLKRTKEYFKAEDNKSSEEKQAELLTEPPSSAPTTSSDSFSSRLSTPLPHPPIDSLHPFVPLRSRAAPSLLSLSQYRQSSYKLAAPGSSRRRNGGAIGMLDGSDSREIKESIQVLTNMIVDDDALENEQALRVLNSFDKKQMIYLPTPVVERAQQLHNALNADGTLSTTRDAMSRLDGSSHKLLATGAGKHNASANPSPPQLDLQVNARTIAQQRARRKFRTLKSVKIFDFATTKQAPSSHRLTQPSSSITIHSNSTSKSAISSSSPRFVYSSDTPLSQVVECDAASKVLAGVLAHESGVYTAAIRDRRLSSIGGLAEMPPSFAAIHAPPVVSSYPTFNTHTRARPDSRTMSFYQVLQQRANQERQLNQAQFLQDMHQREEEYERHGRESRSRRDKLVHELEGASPSRLSSVTPTAFGARAAYRHAPSAFGSDIANPTPIPDQHAIDGVSSIGEQRLPWQDENEDEMDVEALLHAMAVKRMESGTKGLRDLVLYAGTDALDDDEEEDDDNTLIEAEDDDTTPRSTVTQTPRAASQQ